MSTRYTAASSDALIVIAGSWLACTTCVASHTVVVNVDGALLCTWSVTGPRGIMSSPSPTVVVPSVAVNANDGGDANPSTATYRCPSRMPRISAAASVVASPENGEDGRTWIESARKDAS